MESPLIQSRFGQLHHVVQRVLSRRTLSIPSLLLLGLGPILNEIIGFRQVFFDVCQGSRKLGWLLRLNKCLASLCARKRFRVAG